MDEIWTNRVQTPRCTSNQIRSKIAIEGWASYGMTPLPERPPLCGHEVAYGITNSAVNLAQRVG
jgi:hypothetical protein